mgnify:CR=1 FL=1
MKCCPACGQEIPQNARYGVKLPSLKLRLFDLIAARPGISQRELYEHIYPEKAYQRRTHRSLISCHVSQINDYYAHTDIKITARPYYGYYLKAPKGLKK